MFVKESGVCKRSRAVRRSFARTRNSARGCQRSSGLSGARGEGKASGRTVPDDGLTLGDFVHNRKGAETAVGGQTLSPRPADGMGNMHLRKQKQKQRQSFFIETYWLPDECERFGYCALDHAREWVR